MPRATLLDMGLTLSQGEIDSGVSQHAMSYVPPSYTAPEMMQAQKQVSRASDVYGLGLLFYEMLAGHPAFPYRLRLDDEIRQDVLQGQPQVLNRRDLPEASRVYNLINSSLSRNMNDRPQDVASFGKEVTAIFGPRPPKKRSRFSSIREMSVPVFVLLVVVGLLLILVLALAQGLILDAPTQVAMLR